MALLNGWKEIAVYLNRGVRTVQRWEEFGLPVRRPAGRSRAAVIATTEDVDRWISNAPNAVTDIDLRTMRLRADVALHRHLENIATLRSTAKKLLAIARVRDELSASCQMALSNVATPSGFTR